VRAREEMRVPVKEGGRGSFDEYFEV